MKGRLFGKPEPDDTLIEIIGCSYCIREGRELLTGKICVHIYAWTFSDGKIPIKTQLVGGYRAYPYSLEQLDRMGF